MSDPSVELPAPQKKLWTDGQLDALVAWCERAYPEEGCALILRGSEGEFSIQLEENLANKYHEADPESYPRDARTFYLINPMEFVRAEREGYRVAVIVHSHADVGDYFSEEDVAGATLPRFEDDEPLEPTYPDSDYLVISVREGRADHATLFRFDASEEAFEAVMFIDIDDGNYDITAPGTDLPSLLADLP